MNCQSCGFANRSGLRFCENCGAALVLSQPVAAPVSVCTNCGAQNRPGVRFCEMCGTDLGLFAPSGAGRTQAYPPPTRERGPRSRRSAVVLSWLLVGLVGVCAVGLLMYGLSGRRLTAPVNPLFENPTQPEQDPANPLQIEPPASTEDDQLLESSGGSPPTALPNASTEAPASGSDNQLQESSRGSSPTAPPSPPTGAPATSPAGPSSVPDNAPIKATATPGETVTPVDIWDPSMIGYSCPGAFCLRSEPFRWSRNNLSYCVASPQGAWVTAAGHSFNVYGGIVTNADLSNMVTEAVNYWENWTDFDFISLSSCDSADFIIGWGKIGDMQQVSGDSLPPLGFAISINDSPKQFLVVMNASDFNWDRESWLGNYDAASTLAHEIGHSLGLGHDETLGTLMYPSHPPEERLASVHIGDDTRDQLATTYPNYVSWASNRKGFNIDIFQAMNGRPATIAIPFPQDARYVYAVCTIEGYEPIDDDGQDKDMGWRCDWQYDDANRVVYFTLTPLYSDAGTIVAKALVIDNEVFQVVQNYSFEAKSEGTFDGIIYIHPTEFKDLFSGGRYDELYVSNLPSNAIPLINVTIYDSSGDDDFSYWVTADPARGYFDALGWQGNGGSFAYGFITFIQPVDINAWASYCFVSGYNEDVTQITLPESCKFNQGWNIAAFGSLIGYDTGDADYFAPYLNISVEASGEGITLKSYLWVSGGNTDSQASFEVVILQTR